MTALFWCALAAQAVFGGGLIICVALVPSYVLSDNQGGISNYGSDRRTVVPFTISIGGNAALCAPAAAVVPADLDFGRWLRALLCALAVFLLALLVSAWVYKRSEPLRKLHFGCGIALIAYESFLGLWLLVFLGGPWVGRLFWAVMIAADALCLLAVLRIFEKLFVGQLVASLAFGVVLLIALA